MDQQDETKQDEETIRDTAEEDDIYINTIFDDKDYFYGEEYF